MGKVLQILLYIVLLGVIIIWFSAVFNSCGNSATQSLDEIRSDVGEVLEEAIPDEFETSGEPEESNITTYSYTDNGDEVETASEEETETVEEEYTEPDYTSNTNTETTKTSAPKSEKQSQKTYNTNTPSSSTGQYKIIAGSYGLRENAEKMLSKIQKAGFNNAYIGQFSNSSLHVVVAGKYATKQNAQSAKTDLDRMGVDNFITKS